MRSLLSIRDSVLLTQTVLRPFTLSFFYLPAKWNSKPRLSTRVIAIGYRVPEMGNAANR